MQCVGREKRLRRPGPTAAESLSAAVPSRGFKQTQLRLYVPLAMSDIVCAVLFYVFIAPLAPTITSEASKEFQIGAGRTGFNNIVNLVGFS